MYDAIDISRLVINYCIDINKPIINIKLVKIIFMIQYEYWEKTGELFFKNDFSKNSHGGYIDEVYEEFSINGIANLPCQDEYQYMYYNENTRKISMITKFIKDIKIPNATDLYFIKTVTNKYIDKDKYDLVRYTNEILKDFKDGDIIDWNKIKRNKFKGKVIDITKYLNKR